MKRIRRIALIALSITVIGLASCGKADSRKPTFPVSGKVLLAGGKPAEHATVVLHPVDDSGPDAVKPRGKVNPDGSFTLTTYDGNDGAPAGNYRVTVELWLASGKSDEGPKSRLPAKYAKPETSGLTATVATGPTDLKPIELKR
jgi:hypothetical protein